MTILAVNLGPYWFLPNSYYPQNSCGFYTVTESTTPLPTEPYQIYYYNWNTFLNNIAQTLSDNSDIKLATTLSVNIGQNSIDNGTSPPSSENYSSFFTVTLYPFLNGSNIVINGGATAQGQESVYTQIVNGAVVGEYTYSTKYNGYTLTVLDQSFSVSDTDCTLYFSVDKTASTETPSSCVQ